jgi:endonuclease-3
MAKTSKPSVSTPNAVGQSKPLVKSKPVTTSKSNPVKSTTADAFKKVTAKVAEQEMRLLCQKYPEAECELDFASTFQLLTAVIMSAQTTDVTVNRVTKTLFARFPDAKALAEADLDEIKEIIKSTGYYNAKATNIQNCAKALVEHFGGTVPATMDALITLPGVGRKTANVVLGVAFGVPGWTVDTHVQRLSHRLGLTAETDPGKIEIELQKLFPHQDWSKHSITLIWHGRRTCFARNPDCPNCPINHLCPSSQI